MKGGGSMILQIAAIFSVFGLAYLALQMLGPRPPSVFISLKERQRWAELFRSRVGRYFYIANIAATLTSLATVYVFFIGNSSLFGYAIYVSVITIVLGTFANVPLTKRLLGTKPIREKLQTSEVSTVAVTALFWSAGDIESQRVSRLSKYLTITSILAILWLEFATATYLAAGALGIADVYYKSLIMFLFVYLIFDFTVRNGLRGFIFLDLFLAPLILVGSAVLAIGAITLAAGSPKFNTSVFAATPILSIPEVIIFVVATIFLNSFILVTTESHWIRVWTMPSQLSRSTFVSMSVTALIWALLIAIGLCIIILVKAPGINAVVDLLQAVSELSPLYGVAFWVAAIAALLSTCDAQLYSLMLIWAFDTKSGTITRLPALVSRPSLGALGVAAAYSIIFYVVSANNIPLDPIVFFLFPAFLCLLPPMIQLIKSDHVTLWPLVGSIALYLICGLGMLVFPNYSLFFALGAPLMPALISALVWCGVLK
jgi:hypothetical protein